MKSNLTITRKSVEHGSWKDIAENINNGEAYRILSVEDSLSCKLTDGSFTSIDVLDINDEEVVFGFHQSFGDFEMNMINTNAGGFPESRMLQHLNTNIMNLLPDELLEVITPRHIVQNFGDKKFECDAKLWLPSIYEVFGEEYAQWCCDKNKRQFEFFKNPQNRVKFQQDGQHSIYWWLRSPYVNLTTTFQSVNECGTKGTYNANFSLGVCPCFIIRKSTFERDSRHEHTTEAIEVVRCKDCKHFIRYECKPAGTKSVMCNLGGLTFGEDDYCSYGEQK